jgi:hypothetical protein
VYHFIKRCVYFVGEMRGGSYVFPFSMIALHSFTA